MPRDTSDMNHRFLLVGNGPYLNRGCEAIVRGTMRILRCEFGESIRAMLASFGSREQMLRQRAQETDPSIEHLQLRMPPRFSAGWWLRQADRVLGTSLSPNRRTLGRCAAEADAVLQIGGDNYSLDYGYPKSFMEIDEIALKHGKPLVLWGASVGPFDADPAFRDRIALHLRRFDAIIARESRSEDILRKMGVIDNVSRMTDPAFVMEPVEPEAGGLGFDMPDAAVGLNLSPLMAKYVTGGDLRKWAQTSAEIVSAVLATTGRPIVLVPHVTSPDPKVDDGTLLRSIGSMLTQLDRGRVHIVGDNLSAAETKWLISRCDLFAGARTHSTIAAISSGVPTLCFAYSTKARGLSEAVYGSTDNCLEPEDLNPQGVAAAIARLDAEANAIRAHLRETLPGMLEGCFAGADTLRKAMSRST